MSVNPIDLTKDIKENYTKYLSSTFHLKDQTLREVFLKEIKKYNFIKGPFLEAIPPFKEGNFLSDLIREGVLNVKFRAFIFDALDYLKTNPLYLHQEKAIRKLIQGRNLVISSGTSSGKTECFLLAIYNHLLNEYQKKGSIEPGVRALLLYPMNALANDQLRRLREIAEWMEKKLPEVRITFGRYTGETPSSGRYKAIENVLQTNPDLIPVESELFTRKEMQESPPHILITNYAMLEYLLLRPDDTPLFDGEFAKFWKFLVLDEAHIYSGATGIEMALLIRRLKDRVCVNMKEDLQCIATSATIVSESEDFKNVTTFASNLFGEVFDWNDSNENEQDIIEGQRIDIEIRKAELDFPLSVYQELEDITLNNKNNSIEKCDNLLKELGISQKILADILAQSDGQIKRFIYHTLSKDIRLNNLKQLLKDGTKELDICIKSLLNDENPSEEARHAIISLINLSVWAKLEKETLPLLPARYHLFVRSPEGAFVCFYPKKEIFLDRKEKTEDNHLVFELAACKRCGQEYLVGYIQDNKLKHTFSEMNTEGGRSKTRNKYFILWDKEMSFEEDEDQEVSIPEVLLERGERWELCVNCGLIYQDYNDKCNCEEQKEIKRTLFEITPKDDVLNKCFSCGMHSPNIVRKFIFGQNDLNSILVSTLYQTQNKDAIGLRDFDYKKILIFSDSRQSAAFFAPFLELEYNKILFRRIIVKALEENKFEDYSLNSLANDVNQIVKRYDLLGRELDQKGKFEMVWRWVLFEFCALFDKRNSLERLGLVSFKPLVPDNWAPIKQLLNEPWKLTEREAIQVYYILLNTLRYNFATSFPINVSLDPSDDFFYPRNHHYKFRNQPSNSKRGIYSFIPTRGQNTRSDFLRKLFKQITGKEDENKECTKILGLIWSDLIQNWKDKGITSFFERGSKEGTVSQLDYKYWRLIKRKEQDIWYYCDKCGTVFPFTVKKVCPTYNCYGEVKEIDKAFHNSLLNNFYRSMYLTFKPIKMVSHEHTAQLAPKYASEIQQKFIKGDINILSCSTTFELGVDLGKLQSIFLRNVPPEPSNYVQRAGRAGRRLDSIGYTVTFAHLRSHDLSYFRNPEKMIDGRIKPPEISLSNEKIIRRHLHSIALADFFKKNKDHFGVLNKFIQFDNPVSGVQVFIDYLKTKPESILSSLKRVTPLDMQDLFEINTWGWLEEFIGRDGALSIANDKVSDLIYFLTNLYNEKKEQWMAASQQEKNRINSEMNWIDRRINTIKNQRLINFFASQTVIPKYGFPVDVVELMVLSQNEFANNIKLERDLRIALSEFAPGSQVVADKMIWESAGLRVIRKRAWSICWYGICLNCGRFFLEEGTLEKNSRPRFSCDIHGNISKISKFVIPEFGFVTDITKKPQKAGLFRPKREFTSRPFFYEYKQEYSVEKELFIGDFKFRLKYASQGELAVICKGKDGGGFWICFTCGRGFSGMEKEHKDPYGRKCSGILRGPLHLGHRFKTDVVLLNFIEPTLPSINKGFCLSLLYGLLEGVSGALGIKRRDLDGCLSYTNEGVLLILFDNVPGGAGHVKRLIHGDKLLEVFESALNKLENCTCGEETSCYSCLRNYQNQFCHHLLRRGNIFNFLRYYLYGKKKEDGKQKEVDEEFKLKIGMQGEENALNYLKKIKKEEYNVDKEHNHSLFDKKDGFIIKENEKIIFDATWENAPVHGEQYKGYDISFIDETETKKYIEVKATVSSNRDWFHITPNEWKYFLKGERYFIFRVYNVKIGKVVNDDIKIIEDPNKEWQEGKIIVFPSKIEI